MSDRKPRGAVPRNIREQRVEERDRRRSEDAVSEDHAMDEAVRRSIRIMGPDAGFHYSTLVTEHPRSAGIGQCL